MNGQHFAQIQGSIRIDEALAEASGRPTRRIHFTFGRVNEPSQNGDFVPRDEVVAVADRLQAQAIDLLHNYDDTIGAFDSPIELIKEGEAEFFGGQGNLWEWRYPEEVAVVVKAHAAGQLAGSMEMGFKSGVCSECSHDFGPNSPYPLFWDHRDRMHGGKAHRILRGLDPRGAALLPTNMKEPGYEGTRVIALASRQKDHTAEDNMAEDTKKPESKETSPESKTADTELAVSVGRLQQEIETAKSAHTAELQTIAAERDELKGKVASMEVQLKADDRIAGLMATLKTKLGDAYEMAETVKIRVLERAKTLADDAWTAFSEDCVELAVPVVATAGRKNAADAPPVGGNPLPLDKKPKDPLAATRVVMGDLYGQSAERARLAIAQRTAQFKEADEGEGEDDA